MRPGGIAILVAVAALLPVMAAPASAFRFLL